MTTKLLIVDDEETIVFALKRYFQNEGYEVDSARELEEAEAFLMTSMYGIVLVDLALGGRTGTEGLELVRYARRHSPGALIVMMTGYGTRDIELEAVDRGIDAFVHKPAKLEELGKIVEQLLGGPS